MSKLHLLCIREAARHRPQLDCLPRKAGARGLQQRGCSWGYLRSGMGVRARRGRERFYALGERSQLRA